MEEKWHPDKQKDQDSATSKFQVINEAYQAFSVVMEQRLTIDAITPLTTEWTCKVHVVDKFLSLKSKDQIVHFQTINVQDENEEQVSTDLRMV
ncbi:hypothetical protein P3L10_012751 [Capsicum annuum]